jgi:hypothetical protein
MRIGKSLNRLLRNCAAVAEQRHLPDVAEILKQAAALAGVEHLRDVGTQLDELVKGFEAKLVAGEEVSAADLPNIPPPVEPDPNETFEPLPDAVDEEATAEADEEDLLADLEADLDETVTD